jgi:hypothetical protein
LFYFHGNMILNNTYEDAKLRNYILSPMSFVISESQYRFI